MHSHTQISLHYLASRVSVVQGVRCVATIIYILLHPISVFCFHMLCLTGDTELPNYVSLMSGRCHFPSPFSICMCERWT